MTEPAKFVVGDKQVELPYVEATQGNNGHDINKLLAQTGDTTYDQGFSSTASCKSAITFIDGDAGVLQYRGYPIEQLAEQSSFLECAYLVIYGELPTKEQLTEFETKINQRSMVDERIRELLQCFPRNSHPMPVLSSGIMALSTREKTGLDPESVEDATISLLAKVPTLAAYGYKTSLGEPTLYPDRSLSYIENFERLSFGNPTEPYHFNEAITNALEALLILHVDHEQNCSTSTVRLIGSSQANIFASVAGGVNALSGPLHGGANQSVLEMLQQIKDSGMSVQEFVTKVKNKESGIKLMGFGHRIYKNYDPRANIIKRHADEVLKLKEGRRDLLDIAQELEQTALQDDYFMSRKLYPNVDFYSGLIYEAMGFPVNMFTVLFAIGRLPGWIAQWREQNDDKSNKIGRPRQIYVGETKRDYVPLEQR